MFGSGLNGGAYAGKVLAHGATGGVMSVVQGGKFGHGFASAGVTQAFAPGIDRIGGGASSYAGARVAVAAVLGGTAAKLSGGKFANGAITAAFSRAFNDEGLGHRKRADDLITFDDVFGDPPPPPERSFYSASDSTVDKVGWENPDNHKQGFGFRIRAVDSEGNTYIYAHADPGHASWLARGSLLREGQWLGSYASPPNGTASGPHLHFEVRNASGAAVNPGAYRDTVMPRGRVTSGFNPNRRHPVLNVVRPHRGIDLVESRP